MILECFEYNQHFVAMMNIINHARLTNNEGKFQKHHIIPRCFYKKMNLPVDNSDSNLVKLTFEEHKKVHQLAYLCARDIVKTSLAHAFQLMCHTKNKLDIIVSEESRRKMSEAKKGRKLSEEHRKKLSEAKKGKPSNSKGIKRSEETKKKISEASKGRKLSDETRNKISETMKGHTVSEETKRKISETKTGKHTKPHKPHKPHRPFSDETKRKMSEAKKGKKLGPQSEAHRKARSEAVKLWWQKRKAGVV